jgi:predicted MFS family arabinose efflux permease
MSLCAFALVASEFLPVSLLTPLAHDLALTEGQAGQAISVSGIFAVITSLSISSLVGQQDRKLIILLLTGLMVASGVVVAVAPTYSLLMIGRAMLGVAIGGCWSMSTAILMRVVPARVVPKALAMVQGGSALATAVAAPLGSFLGGLVGWRWAFFSVVPLAAIALGWQAMTLPSMPGGRSNGSAVRVVRRMGETKLAFGMSAVALHFMGQFALYTYLRPFLETVTHVDVTTLSLVLLAIGVAGLVGTMLVGAALKRSLHAALILFPLAMAWIALALVAWGNSLATVALLLAAWGFVSTAAPVAWFTWLSKTLPNDAEAGGGLMVATIQLAITAGASIGGHLFDRSGYQTAFHASAGMLLFATLLAAMASRSRRLAPA